MKRRTEDSRQIVDRFLQELGEPLPSGQAERATARVLAGLGVEDRQRPAPSAAAAARVFVVRPQRPWIAIAAAVIIVLLGGALQILFFQPFADDALAKMAGGELYSVDTGKVISVSGRIETGQGIRAGAVGGTVALRDGSRIEMSPGAKLAIAPAADGTSVRLESGTVIVTAAKQRDGHLYVETRDCLVSVVGTVFTVSAEESGSRVSVIQGEVHVQRGETSQTLLPGQQVSTSLALGPVPVKTEIEWSPSAAKIAALIVEPEPLPAPQPQNPQNLVRGTVTQQSTGEGIPDAAITLCASSEPGNAPVVEAPGGARGGRGAQSLVSAEYKAFFFTTWNAICRNPLRTTTDSRGHFEIKDVAPGQYSVRAQRDGYFAATGNGAAQDGLVLTPGQAQARGRIVHLEPALGQTNFVAQAVTIDAQHPTGEVALVLLRGGVISGRIRDVDGRPVANITVSARVAPAAANVAQLRNSWAYIAGRNDLTSRTTDDRGEYRLFGLPPEEYYVAAGSPNKGVSWVTGGEAVKSYFTSVGAPGQTNSQTFYPGVTAIDEARTIVVREGEEVANIDIALHPVP